MAESEANSSRSMHEQTSGSVLFTALMAVHTTSLFVAAVGTVFLSLLLIVAGMLAVVTVVLMTVASWREAGCGYALRHLVLYVVLIPVLLIGPIAVPLLVWSDLTKRRIADELFEELHSEAAM